MGIKFQQEIAPEPREQVNSKTHESIIHIEDNNVCATSNYEDEY